MSDDRPRITVRLVNDHKTGKCWFEEKIDGRVNGEQWVPIHRTEMSCEGNARHELEKEIEERRVQRLMIQRSYGEPQEFVI